MYIVKILKRNDAASVVVAIVLAFILLPILEAVTGDLSTYLSGMINTPNLDWRQFVVKPIMGAFLQVIVLEALLRVVIHVRPYFVRRETPRKKK